MGGEFAIYCRPRTSIRDCDGFVVNARHTVRACPKNGIGVGAPGSVALRALNRVAAVGATQLPRARDPPRRSIVALASGGQAPKYSRRVASGEADGQIHDRKDPLRDVFAWAAIASMLEVWGGGYHSWAAEVGFFRVARRNRLAISGSLPRSILATRGFLTRGALAGPDVFVEDGPLSDAAVSVGEGFGRTVRKTLRGCHRQPDRSLDSDAIRIPGATDH